MKKDNDRKNFIKNRKNKNLMIAALVIFIIVSIDLVYFGVFVRFYLKSEKRFDNWLRLITI